jgi:hypothetical protein
MRAPGLMLRLAPCFAASAFFATMALLYLSGAHATYLLVTRIWGIDGWNWPFLDTDTVLSAVRCVQKGVDVYVANPCDSLARVYDYSPLWLVIARVPGLGDWLNAIGLTVDLCFLASLTLLPTARDRAGAALTVAGAISSAALYATERGNNDLVIFALAVASAVLIGKSRNVRLLAYGAALLAGLLKYYPMPLLMLATREKPRRFLAVAAIAAALIALFLIVDGRDLVRALKLIPTGPYISDMFGSSTLTGGFSVLLDWPDQLRRILHVAMVLPAFAIAIVFGSRRARQAELDRLTERERAFLFVGAILIASCFFTAQNIGYRAVHLLIVLPPLIALRRTGGGRRSGWCVAAALGLLWAEAVRHATLAATSDIAGTTKGNIRLLVWLVRESAWWWLVTMLLGYTLALLLRSEMGGIVLAFGRRAVAAGRRNRAPEPLLDSVSA